MNYVHQADSSHVELPLELPATVPKTELTLDSVESVRRHLDAMPQIEVLTNRTAIEKLLPSIKKMRLKGYTVEQIASQLCAAGLTTSRRGLARMLAASPLPKREQIAKS